MMKQQAAPPTDLSEDCPSVDGAPTERARSPARLGWLLALLVPLAAGLLSLALGQDAPWDLRNYHLYVAWAYLEGRLSLDMAPGHMQSYFNPWIDLPYYWLSTSVSARWTGFVIGAAHGLVIVPLYAIACRLLPCKAAAACAVAGCLGPLFLYQLGSTTGDNTAVLLVMPAVALMMRALNQPPAEARAGNALLALAGLLGGAAAGLKLTNAPAALALCAMPLAASGTWGERTRWTIWAAGAAALGLLATGGHWFLTMYQHFGNPLFPQFNGLFGSELAARITVLDDRWGPRGWLQTLLWPFVTVLQPWRFGELLMVPLALAATYAAALCWGLVSASRVWLSKPFSEKPSRSSALNLRVLVCFAGVTYVAWLVVFGIGRYLVVLDLLAPVLLATLCWRLSSAPVVQRWVWVMLAFFSAMSVLNLKTWGKADWGESAYAVELPPIAAPDKTAVLMIGDEGQSWKARFFPPGTVFAGLGGNFPASPAWNAELRRWVDQREYVIGLIHVPEGVALKAVSGPFLFNGGARAIAAMSFFAKQDRCEIARRVAARAFYKSNLKAQIEGDGDAQHCRVGLPTQPSPSGSLHVDPQLAVLSDAQLALQRLGLELNRPSCITRAALIGSASFPYIACAVSRMENPLEEIADEPSR